MKKTLLFCCLALSACGDDPHAPENHCEYQERALHWGDESPEGIIPEQLLEYIEIDIDGVVADTPYEDGERNLAIETQRRGDHAYYLESDHCSPEMQFPLTLTFRTLSDDAFDEVHQVRGKLTSPLGLGELEEGNVEVSFAYEPGEISGTFVPEPQSEEGEVLEILLGLTFKPDGIGEGLMSLHIETWLEDESAVMSSFETHWTWEW